MVAHNRVEATPETKPLLDRVLRGERVTITQSGVEVAVLQPVGLKLKTAEEAAQIVREMWEFTSRHSLGGLDVRELRNEGRP